MRLAAPCPSSPSHLPQSSWASTTGIRWWMRDIDPFAPQVTIATVRKDRSSRAQSCQTPAKTNGPSSAGWMYQGSRLPSSSFVHS